LQTRFEVSHIIEQDQSLSFLIRAIKIWLTSVLVNLERPSWIVIIWSYTTYFFHKSPIWGKLYVMSIIVTIYFSLPLHNICILKYIQFIIPLKKIIRIRILKLDNPRSRVYIHSEISAWITFLKCWATIRWDFLTKYKLRRSNYGNIII
jgi:hypothetical protein